MTSPLSFLRRLAPLLLMAFLPGCLSMFEGPPSRPGPGDDVGPKPQNVAEIVANWGNQGYPSRYPFTAEEMIIPDPKPIVYNEPLLGRKVGWQVMIGPENRRLAREIGYSYTRLIIRGTWIISTVSSDTPFAEPR